MKLRLPVKAAALSLTLLSTLGASVAVAQFTPPIELVEPKAPNFRIDAPGLVGNFYPGKGKGKRPGVLLLGGSEGGLGRGTQAMALSLQERGFSVLALAYFRAPGLSPKLELVPMEMFGKALVWLKPRKDVAANRIAVMGGSKGAEAALLIAARHPGVKAVVAGMPSSAVWPGIDWDSPNVGTEISSWSEKGAALPSLNYGDFDPAQGMVSIYTSGLKALPGTPQAAIPVEKIKGKILLVCGEADALWPSCPMARQMVERRASHRKAAPTLLAYADAGHMVFGPAIPESSPSYAYLGMMGGSNAGNAAARADGWPKVLDFLTKVLKP